MSPEGLDPRAAVVPRRLAGVRRILLLAGGKGGVGKSACAAVGGLVLARRGLAVGLLDLDFEGASCHLFLGSPPRLPQEEGGILPLEEAFGLKLMSVASFAAERPLALRGGELSAALLELLAVTLWGELDVLLVDMPPGMGDQLLDVLRLMPAAKALLVTTASPVALAVSLRLAALLQACRLPILGVVENMQRVRDEAVGRAARERGLPYLGALPFDPALEAAVGHPEALVSGALGSNLDRLLRQALA